MSRNPCTPQGCREGTCKGTHDLLCSANVLNFKSPTCQEPSSQLGILMLRGSLVGVPLPPPICPPSHPTLPLPPTPQYPPPPPPTVPLLSLSSVAFASVHHAGWQYIEEYFKKLKKAQVCEYRENGACLCFASRATSKTTNCSLPSFKLPSSANLSMRLGVPVA